MKFVLGLLSLIVCVGLTSGCATTGSAAGSEPTPSETTSSSLMTFQSTDISGAFFDLADHPGQTTTLMNFWATWCEPCKTEMPLLQKLHETYADQGLLVLSISQDGPDTMSGVAPYIHSNGYTFPVVIDEDSSITQAYNPKAVAPFSVFIDKHGSIVKTVEGFQLSEAAAIEAEVAELVGE